MIWKGSRLKLFCPACNARGAPQPVLSPLQETTYLARENLEIREMIPEPHSDYKCARCGYVELWLRPPKT